MKPVWTLPLIAIIALVLAGTSAALAADEARAARLEEIRSAIVEKGAQWTAGENPIFNMPRDKRRAMLSPYSDENPLPSSIPFTSTARALPTHFDWRDKDGYDWVTPVRYQADCGSCWSFTVVGPFEVIIRIATDNPYLDVDLSEQFIISCGLGGCSGGAISTAVSFLKNEGTVDEQCFHYAAEDLPCGDRCSDWEERIHKIIGYSHISESTSAIKEAIYQGPVTSSMRIYEDFDAYSGGIYEHTTGAFDGMHAVHLIGWDDAEQYWIAKNSWSEYWGEGGFFRIRWGEVSIGTNVYLMYYTNPCDDTDGDGYGDPAHEFCEYPEQDCDDTDPDIHPCTIEICGNGVDEDCTGGDRPCTGIQEAEPNDTPAQATELGVLSTPIGAAGNLCPLGFDGYQYTGDQDYFRFTTSGSLDSLTVQLSLDWGGAEGDSNFDIRLYAADGTTFIKGDYVGKPREIQAALDPGTQYVVLVAGRDGAPGDYSLTLSVGSCWDDDGDGYDDEACGGDDCDDADPAINPGEAEDCYDGIDNDCDSWIDWADLDCVCWDGDSDGYDDEACGGTDCDDSNPAINPGASEDCYDLVDNDCDGLADGLDPECACWDGDSDGYDDEACGGDDCDDADPEINPGATEDCYDLVDNDCDGLADIADPDCTVDFTLILDASYAGGILSLAYSLGTPSPANWYNYLILMYPTIQVIPLWMVPLPVIHPPMDFPVSFPLAPMGLIGIFTGLFTDTGPEIVEMPFVDTGT